MQIRSCPKCHINFEISDFNFIQCFCNTCQKLVNAENFLIGSTSNVVQYYEFGTGYPDELRQKRIEANLLLNPPVEPEPIPLDVQKDNKLKETRQKRNELLAASDYTQLPDTPLKSIEKQAYREYRQKLRDLPSTIAYINLLEQDFIWPDEPKKRDK